MGSNHAKDPFTGTRSLIDKDHPLYKEYFRKGTVAVIGGGSFGTTLANLVAENCSDVRMWVREEEQARNINATRTTKYIPGIPLNPKVHAYSGPERIFEGGVTAVIWALPAKVCREQAKALAKNFRGDEIVLHSTKGIEDGTLKTPCMILREELPCARVGVISGPNLADEISKGQPAATVVASKFDEVIRAGQILLTSKTFRIYGSNDVVGVEWAGTLKNIFAIAAGTLDALNLGWNSRSMLMTRGLAEMVRFGAAMGGDVSTFLGLAGVGDLFATCSSNLSRNYRVGIKLAQGQKVEQIVAELGSTAEGVRTARIVAQFAKKKGISMPITDGVVAMLDGSASAQDALRELMTRPPMFEEGIPD
ncbi:MAG: NAD(P)-dependent glycerol-3-phosphate dehydrogenase [Bdellovibrionales bacterium]|nr:NAD(P)-dependent glycerol-3-phosphate dehydrogenase [Bdellovibrionales bacterium]